MNIKVLFSLLCAVVVLFSCSPQELDNPQVTILGPNGGVSVKGYKNFAPNDTVVMNPNVVFVSDDINSKFVSHNKNNKPIVFKE